jgi:hypothetical protein
MGKNGTFQKQSYIRLWLFLFSGTSGLGLDVIKSAKIYEVIYLFFFSP